MTFVGLKEISFECGELIRLGPFLWSDVDPVESHPSKEYYSMSCEDKLKTKLVLYLERRYIHKLRLIQHKILYNGEYFWITDNSFAVLDDKDRNLQKVNYEDQ